MKKLIVIILITVLPYPVYAGNWIAVDGGVFEVDIIDNELENALWDYLAENTCAPVRPGVPWVSAAIIF